MSDWDKNIAVLSRAITQRDIAMDALIDICNAASRLQGNAALVAIEKIAADAAFKLATVKAGVVECLENQLRH